MAEILPDLTLPASFNATIGAPSPVRLEDVVRQSGGLWTKEGVPADFAEWVGLQVARLLGNAWGFQYLYQPPSSGDEASTIPLAARGLLRGGEDLHAAAEEIGPGAGVLRLVAWLLHDA